MKRNGAGLASICILSTMVLVMVSSTTSLYLSMEHGLNLRYPKSVQIEMYTKPEQTEENERESEWTDYRACTEGFERT